MDACFCLPTLPAVPAASTRSLRSTRRTRYVVPAPVLRAAYSGNTHDYPRRPPRPPGRARKPKTPRLQPDTPSPPEKTQITLAKLLGRQNVASSDTCPVVVRSGLVAINGAVETDPYRMVRLGIDEVIVNGALVYGKALDDEETESWEEPDEDDLWWERNGPRARRDAGEGRKDLQRLRDTNGKYSGKVDGGFFSRRGKKN